MTPTDWLLGNDTGTSSKTILAVMTNSQSRSADIPYDNDDFGRCYRLLRLFPQWRSRLPEVAQRHPAWGPMVTAWDELCVLWEAYCDPAGYVGHKEYEANKDAAKRLYARMKVLVDESRRADGWKEVSKGSWVKDKETIMSFGRGSIRTS